MKSFIQKVLILVGLVSIVPFFSYAAGSLSCSSDYSAYLMNKADANFTAELSGGVGTYVYSWSGDVTAGDVTTLTGINFTSVGTKQITVTASSTDEILSDTCSVDIFDPALKAPTVGASCSPDNDMAPIGQAIEWISSVDGPIGPYTVSWRADGFSNTEGERISTTTSSLFSGLEMSAWMTSVKSTRYSDDIAFHAFDINTETLCDGTIYVVPSTYSNPVDFTVTGTCSVSDTSVYTNDLVTWDASTLVVTGAIDPVVYNWSDAADDSSMGTGTTTTKTYTTTGEKSAKVMVVSGSRSKVVNCSNIVTVRNRGGGSTTTTTEEETATTTATSTPSTATSTTSTATSTATSTSNISTSTSQTSTSSTLVITGGSDVESDDTGVDGTDGDSDNNGTTTRPIFTEDIIPGSYGEAVADLQQRLTEEGFYNGLVGGFFGPATEEALKAYQAANGLPVTGILDAETRAKLNMVNDLTVGTSTSATTTSSGIAGLLSAAVGTMGDFGAKNWSVILYSLIVVLAIGLISWLFMIIKKSDKNK